MAFVDSGHRYERLRKLGEGGMGVVYEVRDVMRNMRVALKTIRNVNAEAIFRLKREFRALSELSHPNIINLYELVADRDVWFMTMEVVEGCDLLRYVRHGRLIAQQQQKTDSTSQEGDGRSSTTSITRLSGPVQAGSDSGSMSASIGLPTPPLSPTPIDEVVDLARLKQVLTQLAEALHTLHRADMVHRDLKPSNVLVTAEGRAVLMDFGIVAELRQLSEADTGALGTPHYMAPEQAKGNAPQTAADWYAFGVILYEALTGRLPFTGGSLHVLQIKQHRQPLPPRVFASGIPTKLEDLCMALLAIEPAARPQGQQVLDRLGARHRRRRRHSTMPTGPAPLFVGRAHELRVLAQKLHEVVAGNCRSVIISGPSGIGKTSLLSYFLNALPNAQRSKMLVLTGQCRERENLIYKAFDGVMEQLARFLTHQPEQVRQALTPADIDCATHIFPALNKVTGESAPAPPTIANPSDRRARGLAAIRQLVASITSTTPIILRIEDIQWADHDSLALLGELLQESQQARILLAMTLRLDSPEDDIASPDPAVARFINRLQTDNAHKQLHLMPLGLAEQRALVESAAAFTEFQTGADQLENLLWNQPIGHPMLILELMRSAADVDSLGNAPSLESMLHMRVDSLGEPAARTLMDYIALAGSPLPLTIFARASGLSQSECERALSILRVNLLVHNQRSTPHPWPVAYHDKIRVAIIERIPLRERVVMHKRLARALADWPDAPAIILADQWQAAGEPQRAAWSRFCAARDAVKGMALESAAELYRSVLRLMPDPPVVREHAKLVCQTYIGLVETARIIHSRDDQFVHLGRAHDIALQHNLIDELAIIHFLWGSLLFTHGKLDACHEQHELAHKYALQTHSPFLQARALSGLGDAYYMNGRMHPAYENYHRCIQLARDYELDEIAAGNLYMRGTIRFYRNELQAGLRDCADAVATAARVGHKRAEILARGGCLALILYEMAEFDRAYQELDIALRQAREIRGHRFESSSLAFMAKILAIRGNRREAVERAREGVAASRATGMAFIGPMALSALATATDDETERDQALAQGWLLLRQNVLCHNPLWFHRDAIDVFLAAGQPDRMDQHALALEQYIAADPLPWSRVHIARARALANHLRGHGDPHVLSSLHNQATNLGLHHAATGLAQALHTIRAGSHE